MADVLTPQQRSFNMSQIKSENTLPEVRLQKLLRLNGIKNYKAHPKDVPGRPDIFFPKFKYAIFVDGCFWHACKGCYQEPKTNQIFWQKKIKSNNDRDKYVNKSLNTMGISVTRIKEHNLKKNPDRIIRKIKEDLLKSNPPRALDLFSGAGGLTEGFIKAGYKIIGHVEMDEDSCKTLTTRKIYYKLKEKKKLHEYKNYLLGKTTIADLIKKYKLHDIERSIFCESITGSNFRKLIQKIKLGLNQKKVDIIIGGPPCQAYSYIGRARDRKGMKGDKRNYLYKYYVEFLKAYSPKIFVFENVPGLLTAGDGKYFKHMRHLMKKAGYETDYKILNASDYGVPQNRKRVILIGWNQKSKLKKYPELPKNERTYIVRDFLSGLPKINSGEGKKIMKYQEKNKLLRKLGITEKKFDLLMDHVSRPNNKQDLEIYSLAVKERQKGRSIKYNFLPKRLKSHNKQDVFLDRFKVVDYSAKGAHTIVAHISKDGHYYIHPDLEQNRSLTVREAARLQTFPDNYIFEGSRTSQFRQIGNAVPVMLSTIIAKELLKYI